MASSPDSNATWRNTTTLLPANFQASSTNLKDNARSDVAATGVGVDGTASNDRDGCVGMRATQETISRNVHPSASTSPPSAELPISLSILETPEGPQRPRRLRRRGAVDRRQGTFTCARIMIFLSLHFASFAAQVAAMANFLYTNDYWFFFMILCPFLFSGVFCTCAAWQCDAPRCCPSMLPLKSRSCLLACFLAIPFGFGQVVIVSIAMEEYLTQRDGSAVLPAEQVPNKPNVNKFHLKAVNGLFEGLLSFAVLLYAYWSMDYPPRNQITKHIWVGERGLLSGLGFIQFFSSGLGLIEMDYCSSQMICQTMERSFRYEVVHWFFRVTEVLSRCSMFIGFMVFTRQHVFWWWFPLAGDVLLTYCLVNYYGGAEKNWFVRSLCSIPCTFANVFAFIDSPYKHRAAMKLSRCLTVKHGLEIFLLPFLGFVALRSNFVDEALCFWRLHVVSTIISAIAIVLYWPLLWYTKATSTHKKNMMDIYSACEKDSVSEVRKVMNQMTKSAAIGMRIDNVDIDGYTPLMCAALRGNARVCQLLLREGAKASIRMSADRRWWRRGLVKQAKRRWTALHMAAWKGHVKVVQNLLCHSGDDAQNFQDTMGDTPLHIAAQSGHKEVVEELMEYRPGWLQTRNKRNQRPVDLARGTRAEEVRYLLEDADQRGVPQVLADSGPGSQLLPNQDLRPNSEQLSQAWPQVQLAIRRSAPEEEKLMAPGLCSYIASNCGGALGRIFLAEPSPQSHRDDVMLSRISEGNGSLPEDSYLTSLRASSIRTDMESEFSDVGVISWTPHPNAPEPGPAMANLEPIDADGNHVPKWYPVTDSRGEKFKLPFGDGAWVGEGSFGTVWRAMDRLSGTWYAVKNIQGKNTMATSVATRECQVADHIRMKPHPGIVKLHHVFHFTDFGLYVLVMEFASGGTVQSNIKAAKMACWQNGRRYEPPVEHMGWIGQIFLGLEHMHKRMNTLLRDLKPANVVITAVGQAKLTDFGFGRLGVESETEFGLGSSKKGWTFGIPAGTPGYVAPEVLRQGDHNSACDLYSLGVLVWVILTGGYNPSPDNVWPPMADPQNRSIDARLKDWKAFATCVAKPAQGQQLTNDARDFVAHLTVFEPEKRRNHEQIRSQKFMEPCRLPSYEAGPPTVEAWLANWTHQIKSQRTA